MYLFIWDFSVLHKYWLIYYGETERPGELYDFSISKGLTGVINFPTRVSNCDAHSRALLNLVLVWP